MFCSVRVNVPKTIQIIIPLAHIQTVLSSIMFLHNVDHALSI